jgi:hypothetical protein
MTTAEPPTDRPDPPPWLEDLQHLSVVLDSLAEQCLRAVEGGIPAGEVTAALQPQLDRLIRLHIELVDQGLIRAVGRDRLRAVR